MSNNTKPWHEHQIFSGLVGAIIGVVGTIAVTLISNNVTTHNYIPFDSINVLFDNYLVEPGYVDNEILELETIDKQFEMLKNIFYNYYVSINNSLINLGYSTNDVTNMSQTELLDMLPLSTLNIYNQNQNYADDIESLSSENKRVKEENDRYREQKTVELKETNLIIDGELMNSGDSIKNAVAIVDGNCYYSQSLLNTHILDTDQALKYVDSENALVVGKQKPEKTKLLWNDMVSDAHINDNYTLGGGRTFTMGKCTYVEGVILKEENYMYIHLNKNYSAISFTYGHVDETSQGNLELTILAMDDNGETYTTTLKTITLSGEMEPKNIEIPLSYTSAIKIIVSDGDYYARYGLTDIYLYS